MSMNRTSLLALALLIASCTTSDPLRRAAVPLPAGATTGGSLASEAAVPFRPGSVEPLAVTFLSPSGPQKTVPGQVVAMFNQPMVGLGDSAVTPGRIPIEVGPDVAVRGHWIGTSIAVVVPEAPLSPSTAYTVKVPAGTTALSGRKLDKDVVAAFETPRPTVEDVWPDPDGTTFGPRPWFVVKFDQPVDPASLAKTVRFTVGDGPVSKGIRAEVKPIDSRAALDLARREVGAWLPIHDAISSGAWYLVRPAADLPRDSVFHLDVQPGVRGTLGPLESVVAKRIDGRTWGPLRVVSTRCDSSPCDPDRPWNARIVFNNPVCDAEFGRAVLGVETPANAWGNRYCTTEHSVITDPVPGRTYTFVVPATLRDAHGQALGREVRVEYAFGHRRPAFDDFVSGGILEAKGPRAYPFRAVNLASAEGLAAVVPPERLASVLSRHVGYAERTSEFPYGLATTPQTLSVPQEPDRGFNVPWNLARLVPEGKTGVVAYRFTGRTAEGELRESATGLIQVTDIGLTLKVSDEDVHFWTTSLSTGRPLGAVRVELRDAGDAVLWSGDTGPDGHAAAPGLATLAVKLPPLPAAKSPASPPEDGGGPDGTRSRPLAPEERLFGVARLGSDATVRELSRGSVVWASQPEIFEDEPGDDRYGYVADGPWRSVLVLDRDVYQPGHEVKVKGWVRRMTGKGPRIVAGGTGQVEVRGPGSGGDDKPLVAAPVFFDDAGAFAWSWKVPEGAQFGGYTMLLRLPGQEETWTWDLNEQAFQVQFYEPPEFSVRTALDRPWYIRGDPAVATATAAYYFGAPMSGAPTDLSISWEYAGFRPPGAPGYIFSDSFDLPEGTKKPPEARIADATGAPLDDTGGIRREIALVTGRNDTMRAVIEVEVHDTTGRTVSGRASALVHPAEFYLGTRAESFFVQAGGETAVGVAAQTPDGKPADPASVEAVVARREWHTVRRQGYGNAWNTISEPVDVPIARGTVPLSGGRGSFRFRPDSAGLHVVTFRSVDARGNRVRTNASLYVVGKDHVAWHQGDSNRIELVPDRREYEPGQTARVLLKSPFASGWALVTVERQAVTWQKVVELKGNSATIEVPLAPGSEPGVNIAAVVVRGRIEPAVAGGAKDEAGDAAAPDVDVFEDSLDLGAPTVRYGAVKLKVSPAANRLAVDVTPSSTSVRPGQEVTVDLAVHDRDGKPAAGQLLVMAVDAAVLDLTGYVLRDPFDTFHAAIEPSVQTDDTRQSIIRRRAYGQKSDSPGGDGGGDFTRKDFVALAFHDPDVRAGADGRARVTFKAPDNLTTFRVLAVASSGEARFGKGSGEFTVSRPLIARPALPPFAEAGDSFRMPVAVHGSREVTGRARVDIEVSGPLALSGAATREVDVGPDRPSEVAFDLATKGTGEGVVTVTASVGTARDSVRLTIPVRIRSRVETATVTGATSITVAERIAVPEGADPARGGLTASAASTALVGLVESARYLVEYPYGCLEQRMSGVLPLVLLEEVGSAYGYPPERRDDLRKAVDSNLARIGQFQHSDGGLGFWPSGGSGAADPYLTAWTLFVARVASDAGYRTDRAILDRARAALGDVLRKAKTPSLPADESAFATFALALAGDDTADLVTRLIASRRDLDRGGLAWLVAAAPLARVPEATLATLVDELVTGAVLDGDTAYLPTESSARGWHGLGSDDVATTAAAVIALARVRPTHPLVEPLLRHLLSIRRSGRWATTHENGLALLAAHAFYRSRETEPPSFRTTPYLGTNPLATWEFAGRSATVQSVSVPTSRLLEAGDLPLTFALDGHGTLYYSLSLAVARAGLLPARDQGIFVRRETRALSAAAEATEVRRGSVVTIDVTIAAPAPIEHLVVDVPVPAGLAPINFSFETSSRTLSATLQDVGDAVRSLSCDRVEYRADRVVCFVDRFEPGVSLWRIGARAVVPGRYAYPGAKAEAMYAPATFGESAGSVFSVVP